MKNRLPRKLKKRIIKCFGRGTYEGILNGYLALEKYEVDKGVVTRRTSKPLDKYPYNSGQYHPHLNFPNINQYEIKR